MKVLDDEKDPRLEELPKNNYKFVMQSTLGGRFRRYVEALEPAEAKKWEDKTPAQRKLFKKQWGMEKFKEYEAAATPPRSLPFTSLDLPPLFAGEEDARSERVPVAQGVG